MSPPPTITLLLLGGKNFRGTPPGRVQVDNWRLSSSRVDHKLIIVRRGGISPTTTTGGKWELPLLGKLWQRIEVKIPSREAQPIRSFPASRVSKEPLKESDLPWGSFSSDGAALTRGEVHFFLCHALTSAVTSYLTACPMVCRPHCWNVKHCFERLDSGGRTRPLSSTHTGDGCLKSQKAKRDSVVSV